MNYELFTYTVVDTFKINGIGTKGCFIIPCYAQSVGVHGVKFRQIS